MLNNVLISLIIFNKKDNVVYLEKIDFSNEFLFPTIKYKESENLYTYASKKFNEQYGIKFNPSEMSFLSRIKNNEEENLIFFIETDVNDCSLLNKSLTMVDMEHILVNKKAIFDNKVKLIIPFLKYGNPNNLEITINHINDY